jgi:SAM-dependent methyltransferase
VTAPAVGWDDGELLSPVSGAPLHPHTDSFADGDDRWPVIDGIPFLRADRRALADEALTCLDAGRRDTALALLLGDQDGFAPDPPPSLDARLAVVDDLPRLSFRDAMERLGYGPVAAYFAHRWSDPTFLSGLALAEAHWRAPARVFELACGAGHFLREFSARAATVSGGDLVFSKLWLARHFVAPRARLVCFDAGVAWPLRDASADLVFCHDAFYFLPEKPHVAREMRRVAGDGAVLVGHAHNAAVDNWSAGRPLTVAQYAELLRPDAAYDDAELARAIVAERAPRASSALEQAAAVSFAVNAGAAQTTGRFAAAEEGARLRRNPLYVDGRVAWPSPRYEAEYGPLATYPERSDAAAEIVAGPRHADAIRRREYVDLPERW